MNWQKKKNKRRGFARKEEAVGEFVKMTECELSKFVDEESLAGG